MVTFCFFFFTEIHKRRKSLRRKFDSFSKEKKERGKFIAQTQSCVVKDNSISGHGLCLIICGNGFFPVWPDTHSVCYSKYYYQRQCPLCPLRQHYNPWRPVAFTANGLTYLKYCVYKAQVAQGAAGWLMFSDSSLCLYRPCVVINLHTSTTLTGSNHFKVMIYS